MGQCVVPVLVAYAFDAGSTAPRRVLKANNSGAAQSGSYTQRGGRYTAIKLTAAQQL